MLEKKTNKLGFPVLTYFVILLYKLRNFIKIYGCYENDPIKGIFGRLCQYFISARKVSWNINVNAC